MKLRNIYCPFCQVSMIVLLVGFMTSGALAQIQWRISVKFILDNNGNRPTSGPINTDAEVNAEIDSANAALERFGRGYAFQLVEIVNLPNVSQWFDSTRNARSLLEDAATENPATYAWRDNMINVYINRGAGAGICSFPGGGNIIFIGQGGLFGVIFHEAGHFFNLCHTQGCNCASCGTAPGICTTIPGNDNVDDTIGDLACWNRNQIAQYNFSGKNYNALNANEKKQVDNVFQNIMSYHSRNIIISGTSYQAYFTRLTSDQLDRATVASYSSRNNVATGRTRFVSVKKYQYGDPVYATVRGAIDAAETGDIVLVRVGNYSENLIVTKPVTLRASRGNVVIGAGKLNTVTSNKQ